MFFLCLTAAVSGAFAGSFLHAAARHIVRNEPVFRRPFFVHAPFSEVFFSAVTLCSFLRFGFTVPGVRNYIFFCCLYCLSLVDAECYRIPDGCVFISLLAWAVAAPFVYADITEVLISVMSGLGLGGIFFGTGRILKRLTGRDALGGGDVKLLVTAGVYTGPAGALFTALLACAGGLTVSLLILRRGWRNAFPFGPAIAAAGAFMLLSGDALTAWYLGLLGL